MTGVTAFSGMIPASPGRMQMKLQSRAMAPPVSMVTGSRELWLEDEAHGWFNGYYDDHKNQIGRAHV